MAEWGDQTLGEVLTLQRGFDITKKSQRPGSIPVVSSSGINSFHDEARAEGPGVVIGRKGSLGTAYFMHGPYWPHDTTLWVKDFKGNDPYFCYLVLKAMPLAELDVGAANPTLNRNHAHALPVRVPSLATQKRVATVAAVFDDLIAINERRIGLLEDLARSLYREWFVRLRFPGHDEVDLVDSDLGLIPEGWVVGTVDDFLPMMGGGTPSKQREEFWVDGTIEWFTPSDLTRGRTRFVERSATRITTLGLEKSAARMFPAGSVLMTSRATLGVLAIALREATCNQGFIVIPPVQTVPPTFIYEWLASRQLELETIATGATFKEITKGAFKRFLFLRPLPKVLERFSRVVTPISDEIAMCERTNHRLRATRDLLIPRLVTGRLDISEVDLGAFLADAEDA